VALWIRNASDLQQRTLIGDTFQEKLDGVPRADSNRTSGLERVEFNYHEQRLFRAAHA
jgi:hypothetical protein